MRANGDCTPPPRRSVAFAGLGRCLFCVDCNRVICLNRLALGLPYRDAGPGCLLVGVGWDLWGWNRWWIGLWWLYGCVYLWKPDAGLVEIKIGFLELVDRMGKWPGYGGSAVAMGEWQAYGDLPKRMGRCVRRVAVWGNRDTVWGNGLCGRPLNRMGEPRKRMGNATGYGNLRRHMGRPPGRMGSLDPKITLSVDRADNVQLNRAFTAENVAQMIINRGRSGMESLRKGDLLPERTFRCAY